MKQSKNSAGPLDGISVSINKRHAFVHERLLAYIVRETERSGGVVFHKKEMAKWLGCCEQSLNRAAHRLRADGLIESQPQFLESGAQAGNRYVATEAGKVVSALWQKRASSE